MPQSPSNPIIGGFLGLLLCRAVACERLTSVAVDGFLDSQSQQSQRFRLELKPFQEGAQLVCPQDVVSMFPPELGLKGVADCHGYRAQEP